MNDLEIAKKLAQKLAEGDRDETERFVNQYYGSVFRMLRHLTRMREDAEDLTQQTFVVARTKIGRYRGEASLKTWVHRIAFFEYAQWKRKQRKTSGPTLEQAFDEPGYRTVTDGESILTALSALPDKHREAFVLFEIEELSVSEIAAIVKVPSGTVKARLFYARRKLRDLLDDRQEMIVNEPTKVNV